MKYCSLPHLRSIAFLMGGLLLASPLAFGQATAPGDSSDESVVRLSPFEVSSSTDRGYIATRASGATKTNTPMIELAHSVQVFNAEFIVDTGASTIGDLVRYTGNSSGTAPESDSRILLRGFPINRLRNGIQFPDAGAFTFDELAPVERVEVIKGASAVLFGTSAPGGLVNIVDKRPLDRRQTEVALQIGSYEFYRAMIDTTGPLHSSDSLGINYRIIASLEDSDSWRDFTFRKRTYLNGQLGFKLGRNTRVLQKVDYQDDDLNENYAKPYIWFPPGASQFSDGVLLNLPDSFSRGERPPLSYKKVQRFNWETVVEHFFNENWSARATAVYADVYGVRQEVFIAAQTANINIWPRFWQYIPEDQQMWVYEANLIGEFELGPTRHTLLMGFNYFDNVRESANLRFQTTGAAFNVKNPVYGAGIGPEVLNVRRVTGNTAQSSGFFLQDQIRLFGDRLHLTGGLRRDTLDQEVINRRTNTRTSRSDRKTSPRYGALWRVSPEWSLYVSLNESFTPSPGTVSVQGIPFPTPTGEQTEFGVKFELLEGRLNGSVSYFELKRQNLTTVDVLNPGFSVATGEVASDGFEMDLGFSITSNWQIIMAFGKQSARVTKDNNPLRIGERFQNVPKGTASFWTKYDVREGPMKGFGFGVGANHERGRISREGGITGIQFDVPDYTVVHGVVSYSWDRSKLALNAENIFDKSYLTNLSGARFGQTGERRQFMLTYTIGF